MTALNPCAAERQQRAPSVEKQSLLDATRRYAEPAVLAELAVLAVLIVAVFLLTGCGGGGGGGATAAPTTSPTTSPTHPPPTSPAPDPEPEPRFSAASLQGAYVFSSVGFEPTDGVFRTIGRFTADGQGGISGQQDNIARAGRSGPFTFDGSYMLDENGHGSANIAGTLEGESITTTLALLVVDENGGVLLDQENDQVFVGNFRRQTSTLNLGRFAGVQVYSMAGGNRRVIGRIEVDGDGAVIGGDLDVNEAGFVRTDIALLSGHYQVDPQTGRSPFRISNDAGSTDFIVYPIDDEEAILMSTDPNFVAAGRLRSQTDAPLSTSLLAGAHVVLSVGTQPGGSVASLARVVLAEDGTISEGRITINGPDELLDDVPLSGTATVNALGVGEATIHYDSVTENLRLRVVDADTWVLLSLAPDQLTSGSGTRQLQQAYGNANFSGSYAFVFNQGTQDTIASGIGDVLADGAGVLTAKGSSSRFRDGVGFSLPTLAISGTYDTRADGRGTASLAGLSDQIRYYQTDDDSMLMIGMDPGETLNLGLTRRFMNP